MVFTMSLSDAGQTDPSMLGTSSYERSPLDFYVTQPRTVQSLIDVIEDDLPSYLFWEPFAGTGAFTRPLADLVRNHVSTDIRAYEGFDPDGLFDFFKIQPANVISDDVPGDDGGIKTVFRATDCDGITMADIANLKGFVPDCIITNPPYGKDAERAAHHAIKLMEHSRGTVIFLCRHEWDAAKSRKSLFKDNPAFAKKIVLLHRPRWIEGSKGAPRFPYAYYVWDWAKAIRFPLGPAEITYAE